jgi:hypothetical protein
MMNSLEQESEHEYVLKDNTWITCKTLSVYVHETDEGVVVDIYPSMKEDTEPIASTYAFFSEGEEEEDG